MKKIFLAAITLAMLTSSCKVFRSSKQSDAATTKTETPAPETKVFSVPAPNSDARPNPTSDTMYETADKAVTGKPVSVRSENFTLSAEDQAAYGNKKFFVIVGSFSSPENAGRFKKDLIQQGFTPIVLHSETGNYRVCVDSYNDETAARSRVQNIRTQYPKMADSWLLIRK